MQDQEFDKVAELRIFLEEGLLQAVDSMAILKNLSKFADKHEIELFFNKANSTRETLVQVFSSKSCEIFKNNFFT